MEFTLTAWLGTYWLHTCAAGLVASLAVQRLSDPVLRERLWRATLVLPLFTTTVARAVRAAPAGDPVSERWSPSTVALAPEFEAAELLPVPPPTAPSALGEVDRAAGRWSGLASALTSPAAARALAGVWVGVGALLVLGLLRDLRRWRRGLGARRHVAEGLSVLGGLATPVVVGRDEVCLPARALAELERDELAAVLAHEQAHIARRDPAWMLGVELLVRLAWAQPLVALVARRWRADVERVCDLAAARRVGALPLVRGLERVAAWSQGTCRPALLVPAATTTRSALLVRVEGVLAPPAPARRRTVAGAAVGVAALAAALGCVGVGPRPAEAEEIAETQGAQPTDGATAVMLSADDSDEAWVPGPWCVVGIDVEQARYSIDDARDLDEPELRTSLRALYKREPNARIQIVPDRDLSIASNNRALWAVIDAGFTYIDVEIDRIGTELPAPLRESVLTQVLRHGARGIADVQIAGDGRVDLYLLAGTAKGLGGGFVAMSERWLPEFVELHETWLAQATGSSPGTELVWHLVDEGAASCVVKTLALSHLAEIGARRVGFVTNSTVEPPLWCVRPVKGAAVCRLTAEGSDEAVIGALRAKDRALTLRVGAGVTVGRVAQVMRAARERGVESIAVVEDAP